MAHKLGRFEGLLDRQIEELVFEVNRRAMASSEAWQTPTLLNGWVNAFPAEPVGYYKDPIGRVHFRCRIMGGAYTNGTTLFVLPEGYRPAVNDIVATFSYSGGSPASCRIYIQTDGQVKIYDATSNIEVVLGGISFRAEQ